MTMYGFGLDKAAVTVSTTGAANVATGSAKSQQPLVGEVLAVHLSWPSNIGTGVGVSVQGLGSQGAPGDTILAISASQNSGWYYPRKQGHTSAGALIPSASGGGFQHFALFDQLQISVSAANQLASAVTATVYLRK